MGDYYQALNDRRSEQYKTVLQQAMSVKDLDWDVFATRIEQHPEEASETDSFGITPLHHVLRKYQEHSSTPRLYPIITSLLEANPSSLQNVDRMTGYNALHIACTSRSENSQDIVNALLQVYPQAAMHRSKDGRVALHRARTFQIARRLIDIYPQALAIKSNMHYWIPLHDACSDNKVPPEVVQILIIEGRKWKIGQIISQKCTLSSSSSSSTCSSSSLSSSTNSTSFSCNYCGGLLVDDANGEKPIKHLFNRIQYGLKSVDSLSQDSPLWRKLSMVVKATYQALLQHDSTYDTTTIYNHTTTTTADESSHEDEEEQQQQQTEQSIPLVHAIIECGGNPHIVKKALSFHPNQILEKDIRGRTPLSIAAAKVNTQPGMFNLLLTKDYGGRTAATIKDHTGNLPLHLAVKNGRTFRNGVDILAEVAPESIAILDGDYTDMYPFMIAAIPKYRWDNTCLNTIYSLFKMAPHVLRDLCPEL